MKTWDYHIIIQEIWKKVYNEHLFFKGQFYHNRAI